MLTKWKRLAITFNAVRKSEGDVHAGIRFFDAMSDILGRGEATMIGLMHASESGRRALEEHRSLFEPITNRDRLRNLPKGTLGRAYVGFADAREIYPEQFEELLTEAIGRSSDDTEHGSSDAHFVHDRYRHLHDVWHVVLGYDTDEDGELGILACMGRQNGYRAHYFAAFVQACVGAIRGNLNRLRVFGRGWRRARQAECMISQDWETLLELPLEEVRTRLNVYPLPNADVDPALGFPASEGVTM